VRCCGSVFFPDMGTIMGSVLLDHDPGTVGSLFDMQACFRYTLSNRFNNKMTGGGRAMDVVEAIKNRKSIRCFKSDPVPKEVIGEILEIAGRAPSAMNTQPWEFMVLAGELLENIRKANLENLYSGVPRQPEHTVVGWQRGSIYWDRQVGLAKQIFTLMDIQREDKEKRAQWSERGFRYFDAPAAILLLTDKALSADGPLLDLGAVMQTICLTALNYDLGTCIEDQGTGFPETLRRFAPIPDSKRIIISIAIGYPDWGFTGNKLETIRQPVENYVTWCGF